MPPTMTMITDRSPIAFAAPLPKVVDVAIIGAGIVGTATAFFLAERGISSIPGC
jgi:NADPH-dependent 2,4-dienoyl-CoA reductase/sulfur reductase-like enzyme